MPEEAASELAPDGAPPLPRGPFRALRHAPFRNFWTAQFFSLVGSWMQGVALRWLVYQLTGSQALIGITSAASGIPTAIFAPFGGVIADRVEKRRILILVQIVAGTLALVLWQLTALHWVQVWQVVLVAFGFGLVAALDMPARQSFWVELVGKEDLMSAITLNSSIVNLSRILGPSFAGLLIAQVGTATCFLANAISFLGPLVVLVRMPRSVVSAVAHAPIWASVREGLSYVRHDKAVKRLLLLIGSWSLFGAQFDVLLPVLADKQFHAGAQGYGFLAAAMGVGAIAGLLTAASLESRKRRGRLVLVGSAVAILGLLSSSLVRIYAVALLCLPILGFGAAMQLATCNTLVQSLVPDGLRGRVMGVYSLMFVGLMPLGSLFYGFLGHALGPALTLRIGAACFTALAGLLLIHKREVRRLA